MKKGAEAPFLIDLKQLLVQARASRSAAGPFFRHVLSPTTLWMQYVVAVACGRRS